MSIQWNRGIKQKKHFTHRTISTSRFLIQQQKCFLSYTLISCNHFILFDIRARYVLENLLFGSKICRNLEQKKQNVALSPSQNLTHASLTDWSSAENRDTDRGPDILGPNMGASNKLNPERRDTQTFKLYYWGHVQLQQQGQNIQAGVTNCVRSEVKGCKGHKVKWGLLTCNRLSAFQDWDN